jgi:hypothetical protein
MILALVDDLLAGVRIEEAAKAIGKHAEAVTSWAEAHRSLQSDRLEGVVVDLAISGLDLEELVAVTRESGAPLIAFYPHVDAQLRRAAQRAGIQYVYPRSRFLNDLPNILRERLDK